MPKELRSKTHPNFPAHILSDEEYAELVRKGLHVRYTVKNILPQKAIPIIEKEITKRKNKDES